MEANLHGREVICAFCSQSIGNAVQIGKRTLAEVHMLDCEHHPLRKLQESYDELKRKWHGRGREIELLAEQRRELLGGLRQLRQWAAVASGGDANRIHRIADAAIKQGTGGPEDVE